jgi:hypothetical protein
VKTAIRIVLAASLLLIGGAAPVAASHSTACTGTLTGDFERIDVPDGATCVLEDATVQHSVTVGAGATLITDDTTIKQNVRGRGAASVRLIDTDILGNITLSRTTGRIVIGNDGCAVDPIAGGNIHLFDNFGSIAICQMSVRNNILLQNNDGRLALFDNRVGNNLNVFGNDGGQSIRIYRNTVRGNIQLARNDASDTGIFIVRANSAERLSCRDNAPDPRLQNNTAGTTAC